MPKINTAMILAAGRGIRMRQLSEEKPKPLIKVHNKPLIDYVVDRLVAYGIKQIVVNTCYKGDMIKENLNKRLDINITYSDEETALETGGGIKKALPLLLPFGEDGFFVLAADPLWDEPTMPLLSRMADAWDPEKMDILLAVVPRSQSVGDKGDRGYFIENGKLRRVRPDEGMVDYLYISAQIVHPRIFKEAPDGAFSMLELFDKAQSEGRLAYVIHDGTWYHVGTPEALAQTEELYQP